MCGVILRTPRILLADKQPQPYLAQSRVPRFQLSNDVLGHAAIITSVADCQNNKPVQQLLKYSRNGDITTSSLFA